MAFFLMTVTTLRLTALALYRKPSTIVICQRPPPSVAQYVIRIDTYYVLSIRIIHNTRDGQIWNTQYKGQYNYTFLYL